MVYERVTCDVWCTSSGDREGLISHSRSYSRINKPTMYTNLPTLSSGVVESVCGPMAHATGSCCNAVFCSLQRPEMDRTQGCTAERVELSAQVARGHGIYLVPSFLQHAECDALMCAASEHIRRANPPSISGRRRLPIGKLPRVYDLCDRLIRRTLRTMEDQLPSLARTLFGQAVELSSMDVRFTQAEPAINVYQVGGTFNQHEDGQMLTVLVPLSEASAFEGGGTAFWPTPASAQPFSADVHDYQSLLKARDADGDGHVMLPPRGTAMLFVGSVTRAYRRLPTQTPACDTPPTYYFLLVTTSYFRRLPTSDDLLLLTTVDFRLLPTHGYSLLLTTDHFQ